MEYFIQNYGQTLELPSYFVLDSTINTHPRFANLVQSIRERRGEKVEIRVPLF